jgi:integrase
VKKAAAFFAKVNKLIPAFLTWYANQDKRPTKKTLDNVTLVFEKRIVPFFGNYSICQVDSELIEQYKTKRSQDTRKLNGESVPIKRRTINKELSYFSSFINYCDEKNIQKLDFKIKRYRHKKADKPKPFTMEEIDRILAMIEPDYRLVFLLMADMGLRRDEALYLKAESVQGNLLYIRGKGSKERVIPITTPRLKAELKKALKRKTEYLTINLRTGKPYTTIRKALKRAVTASNINKPIYHHLLRHSFGTNAIRTKAFGVVELKDFMGHADIQTTMIYITLAGADLDEAASLFGDYTDTKKSA